MKSRRSVREFKKTPISNECIDLILEAGWCAPSASNKQPWEFIVIKNNNSLEYISKNARYGRFIKNAPLVIATLTKPKTSPKWHLIDGTIATQQMILEAWALGIGTCWIGNMNREKVKSWLKVPPHFHLLTVIPYGYFDLEGYTEPSRKAKKNLIHYEFHGNRVKE